MERYFLKGSVPLSGYVRAFLMLLVISLCSTSLYAQTVDCSNSANCNDAYCNFAANIERGCHCFDNIDNDGDGKIDKADSNCATYYGLSFVGEGSNCNLPVPTGSPFSGMTLSGASSQNTADTQSKVVVGDVDGDGAPDAVVTSKYARKLSVVATWGTNAAPQPDGSKIGDNKATVDATNVSWFNGTGSCANSQVKPTFEHEITIADIDKDKKAEIFAIVGLRPNSANNPVPLCYYLVGLKYAKGNGALSLLPGWGGSATVIGTDRPGAHGIADMDGDGKAEVYLRDRIYAAETGKLLAYGNGSWDQDITSGPVAADVIKGDNGKMELIAGTIIYTIPSLTDRNPATPTLMTPTKKMNDLLAAADQAFVKLALDPTEYGEDTHSMCSIGDIDRDGFIDVLISGALGSKNGKTTIFYWNVQKNTVARYIVPDPNNPNGWAWGTGRINVGDADGNGSADFSFIAGNQLFCLTTDAGGNIIPLWTAPRAINDSKSGVCTVTIYDFNSDGRPEMVYRDSQELRVIDASTGKDLNVAQADLGITQAAVWACQSHTYTEGPIIADVNGDGLTDICVTCNTNNSFDIDAPLQQQALGQIRLFYASSGITWTPTRKVWNQQPYFVVNIKDDLTLPFPQVDQSLVFSGGTCSTGVTGPLMRLNIFLNQIPFLTSSGCPVQPAPDLAFTEITTNGVISPAVEVIPPICGGIGIKARFNIKNVGDLPITSVIPVSFFNGDPRVAGAATLLLSTSISVTNLQVDGTFTSSYIAFNGPGPEFPLYVVLNNNGSVLPISETGSAANECRIDNNVTYIPVAPTPFVVTIEKVKDNFKCANTAPNNGELRVRIYKDANKNGINEAAEEVIDYSNYTFQWHTGPATSYTPIVGATNYNLTAVAEGTYTIIVKNNIGCSSIPIDATILRLGNDPEIVITVLSDQTKCNPPNGSLQASIVGGSTGYTFEWTDLASNSLGITGTTANGLVEGTYRVLASKDGCTKPAVGSVAGPKKPDAQAQVLLNVIDCLNPSSGSVTADALFNAVVQDPANYTFTWHFYNNATSTQGSVLPPANGTGQTRTGLTAGFYQVVITDNTSQCTANQQPIVEVTSSIVLPTVVVNRVQAQTSCDPNNPNGILTAVASAPELPDPGFTYQWYKGQNTLDANKVIGATSATLTNASGGGQYYTVKVTTKNNCSATNALDVEEIIRIPEVTLSHSDNSICDIALGFNGSVTATVTFNSVNVPLPDPNYTLTWYNGSVVDATKKRAETTNILPQLDGDKYYTLVAVRNDLGCSSLPKTEYVPNSQNFPVIKTDSIASTNCVVIYSGNNISNGSASVFTVDGKTPGAAGALTNVDYSYKWTDNTVLPAVSVNGQTSTSISNIQGGFIYTVEVTNVHTGCKNTDPVPLADASVIPVVSLVVLQENSICDQTLGYNGKIQSNFNTISGNIANYKYTWRNVTDNTALGATPPAQATLLVNQFGGLNGNKTYSVVAENTVLGCTSGVAQVFLPNKILLPVIKTDSIASTNCVVIYNGNNISNGQASVFTVDGKTPGAVNAVTGVDYSYKWTDNTVLPAVSVSGQTSTSISNIQGGFIYTVEVTNVHTGCKNTDPVPLADASVIPVVSLVVLQENSICDQTLGYNGKIQSNFNTISGNIANYKYTWRNVTDNTALGATPPAQATLLVNQFGGLNGNKTYSVVAENTVLGCTSGVAQVFLPNKILLPVIKTDSIASTNCVVIYNGNNISNGQASVFTVDGKTPGAVNAVTGVDYSYKWTDNTVLPAVSVSGQTSTSISNIQGGFIYTVEVTNVHTGCKNTDPVPLADASVIPVVSLVVLQENSICDQTLGYNGKIQSNFNTISGNIANYKYTWRNVTDNTALGDTPPAQATLLVNQFGGLNGNKTYSVVAENTVLGCTSGVAQVFLPNNILLPAIKTDSIASTNCVVIYNGNNVSNGQASVFTVDGKTPGAAGALTNVDYSYKWTDDVTAPAVSVNGQTGTSLVNIQGGFIYTVEVTNIHTGCKNIDPVALPDKQVKPIISLSKVNDNINCDGTPTGKLNAFVSYKGVAQNDPTIPIALPIQYVITWSTSANGDVLSNLSATTYSAFVVDETLGCTSDPDSEVILDALDYPVIDIPTPTDQTSCDVTAPNGAIQATVTGGPVASTFIHTWFEGVGTGGVQLSTLTGQASGATSSLTNKKSEDYTIFVRNETTGCESIKSGFIPNNIVFPEITLNEDQPVTSCINPDGQISTSLNVITNPANFTIYYLNEVNYAITGDPAIVKTTPNKFINGGLTYSNLLPGNYTVLVTDDITHCDSQVETIEVKDATVKATITINAIIPETACGSGNDGSINIDVLPPSTYNYEWYTNGPTNQGPFNFFLNSYLPQFSNSSFASSEDINSLATGLYSVVVRDAVTGCGTVFTANVPFANSPNVTAVPTNSQLCDPGPHNGKVDVSIINNGPIFGAYQVTFFIGSNAVPANLLSTSPNFGTDGVDNNGDGFVDAADFDASTPGIPYQINSLNPGDYLVKVTDITLSNLTGFDCAVYKAVTIAIDPLLPVVTLGQINPNTSCDDSQGEGSVEITVTKNANDPTTPSYRVFSIAPPPSQGTYPLNVGTGVLTQLDGFASTTYTLTVEDQLSGCKVDKFVSIPDQPVLPKIFDVDALNDSYCAPLSNGQISVTSIGVGVPEAFNNYNFEWYTNPDISIPANLIYTADGGGGTTGEVFNGTKGGWSFGASPGSGNGNRTYYVRGKRITGTGFGCYTQLEQKNVLDVHKTPNLTLTTFANTSCIVAATGEGVIRAVTDIVDDPRDANVRGTGTYTYTWSPDPAGGNTSGTDGIGIARLAQFDITALGDNSGNPYTVISINSVNGCTVSNTAVIPTNKLPITLINYTKQDQLICDFDGNITVKEVTIDASNSATPQIYSFNTLAALATNFDFEWYDSNNDGDNDPLTFDEDAAKKLKDATNTDITAVVLSEDIAETPQPYLNMAEGSYYVIARRAPGQSPGEGCATLPTKVDIEKHINLPEITSIKAFANTSCTDGVVEGRIELQVSTTSGVAAESTSTYSYKWDAANPDPSNPFGNTGTQPNAGSALTIPPGYQTPPLLPSNALKNDTYSITVTNDYSKCKITTAAIVPKQKFPITLISFTKQDQLICDPDGRITITEVTIDGSTSNLPVYNFNNATDLTNNFDFAWYDANNDNDDNTSTFSDDPTKTIKDAASATINDLVLSEDPAETTQPFPTMGQGVYYAIATRKAGMIPGAGCSTLPIRVNIEDKHINPQITSIKAFANTSCTDGVAEGRIELQVNTTSGVVNESTSTYTYDWVAANPDPLNNPFGSGNLPTAGSAITIPPGYQTPPALPSDALKNDTYSITVTNDYSKCTITTEAIVPKQKFPITLISFTKQDQLICDPDGRITITEVTIDGSTSNLPVYNFNNATDLTNNFDFAWYDANNDNDNNTSTFSDDPTKTIKDAASATINDLVLSEDPAESTQPFPAMGQGVYYAIATRKAGMIPGAGCSTLPIRVNIEDKHINPQITSIKAFANTSCTDGVAEGRIELQVNTTSGVVNESTSTYTYDWVAANPDPVNNPFGSGNIPTVGNAITIPPGYQTPPALPSDALKNDTYSITVTNDYSKCTITTEAIVPKQKFPITLISFTKQDQLICDPDGRITITEVTIDGSTSNLPVYNFNNATDLTNNFDFAWYDANNDGDANEGTFDSDPLKTIKDGTNATINNLVLSEDAAETTQPYPGMGKGTYWVVATRKAGLIPGAGCSTQPVRISIDDLSKDPDLTFSFANNTSCNVNNPNGSITTTALERDPSIDPATQNYTFQSWTWNNGSLDPVTVRNDASPVSQLTKAFEGEYLVTVKNTVTGCSFTSGTTLKLDRNVSLPNIINVLTDNPTTCLGANGKAWVTEISVGGQIIYHENVPAELAVLEDPARFAYEWQRTTSSNTISGQNQRIITSAGPGLGLPSDVYYVRVTDLSTECSSDFREFEVIDDDIIYPNLQIAQTKKQISCATNGTGSAELQATADGQNDSNADYVFTWYENLDTTDPQYQTGSTISNLGAGDYSVKVIRTSTGCPATALYIVPDDAPSFMPQISMTGEPLTKCIEPYDGAILARVVNDILGNLNTPEYPFPSVNFTAEFYTGTNADVTSAGKVMTNVIDPQTNAAFPLNWLESQLVNDGYTVKITDNNTGCFSVATEVVPDGRVNPVVVIEEEQPMTICIPTDPNGQLSATADGGKVGGYAFNWYAGPTASGTIIQTSNKLIGQTAGTYTVTVTNDITGCFTDANGNVTDATVPSPTPTALLVQDDTRCDSDDGWVTANVDGETLNYNFYWYVGESVKPSPDKVSADYKDLGEGFYTVTSLDIITGCPSEPAKIFVNDASVIPELFFETTASFCEDVPVDLGGGKGNGTITLSLKPGDILTDEITFTSVEGGSYVGAGNYLTELLPGFYDAYVLTSKGCENTGRAEVKTEIRTYNLVTQNNDGKNDRFVVDCISRFPNNNVKVFNRSGVLVYEANNYNNNDVVFQGIGEKGLYLTGDRLPVGTYFYIIDKGDGSKPKTGYLELVK